MGHIVQRLVRNAIMQAVNQVIQKKTQQEAAKFGNEWKGSFHCLVSGYYSGMTVKYLMLPFAVFCMKMMRVIIYWDNGMAFYDKDGNELVQLPRTAIEQMTVKNGKITIPWEGKEYKIIRNPFDNEKEVREMLNFYSPENSKWIAR